VQPGVFLRALQFSMPGTLLLDKPHGNTEAKNFSISDPGSRVKKIPDPGSGSHHKFLSIFNPKIVSKLSEI
jgi:hypothetical protein